MTATDPFPDGSAVEARCPHTPEQEAGPRDAWPWLPGVVLSRCGPDEWDVRVEARELATLEDGSPAPPGTAEDELWLSVRFPRCLRTEARRAGGDVMARKRGSYYRPMSGRRLRR